MSALLVCLPYRGFSVRDALCLLAGVKDDGKADRVIKARQMGIERCLILSLLVHHKSGLTVMKKRVVIVGGRLLVK